MKEEEYRTAEHIAGELLGMMLEDGCDAVSVTWSRSDRHGTHVRNRYLGNHYAVLGMMSEVVERLTDPAEEMGEEEDEEESSR